jgi:hypothetical protein
MPISISMEFWLFFGSGHFTQHLESKSGSILDLGRPGIVEEPVVLQHELIAINQFSPIINDSLMKVQ